MREKPDVEVVVLSDWTADHLEGVIEGYIENKYKIIDSNVQFNAGTVDGVYVFIKGGESGKE